jgi:hypothetical protein
VVAHYALAPEDQQDKFLLMQNLADEVERTGADGVAIIGEVWMVQPADLGPGLKLRPADALAMRRSMLGSTRK